MGQTASATKGSLSTMKAVIAAKSDLSDKRAFRENVQIPTPSEGQVVVRVRAAALNPVDYKLPLVVVGGNGVGLDFSGVVEMVGEGCKLRVGAEVFGITRGSLAEFCLCDESKIALKPARFSWASAAALPTAYLTSYQSLHENGFKDGDALLVIGSSGGCGSAAVQLGRAMGASEIVGICSGANAELSRSLGATEVVDYKTQDYVQVCGPDRFDFVYDTASASGAGEWYLSTSHKVLKSGGKSVSINGGVSHWLRKLTGLQGGHKLMITKHRSADLDTICGLLDKIDAEPTVAATMPFTPEGVEEAFGLLKSRRAKGKVIVEMPVQAQGTE